MNKLLNNWNKPKYNFKKTTKEQVLSLLDNAKAYAEIDDFVMSLWQIKQAKRIIEKLVK